MDASRNYEAEASNFAGALLMPYDDAVVALGRNVTMQQLVRLKAAWGVSIAGLIVRAHQVGVITADRQTSLFKQLSARGWRTREPVVVHREQPALLRRLIEAQFGINPDWRQVARDLASRPTPCASSSTSPLVTSSTARSLTTSSSTWPAADAPTDDRLYLPPPP